MPRSTPLRPKRPFRGGRIAKAAYPWSMWLMFPEGKSTKRFKLVHGKHYRCSTASMAQQVRSKCCDMKVSASIRVGERDKFIEVHISKKEPEYAEDERRYRPSKPAR